MFMCHSGIFAECEKNSACCPTHQYSVKRWGSSSSLNMAEYGHSGIITQPLHYQLQTDMEAFRCKKRSEKENFTKFFYKS